MGGLTSPPVVPLGTTPGEASGPGFAQTNNELYGANVAANWSFVGAGSLALAASWENGFAPGLITAAAAGDFATGALSTTYNTVSVPPAATDQINCLSSYILAALTGVQSPQCRLQFTLTAGPTYSIDVDPRTGVLIAQAGNPLNPRVERLVLPLYGTTENVTIYRISFAFDSGGIATGIPWFWPRTDGGAAGGVIFGGTQLEGMVRTPSAFIVPGFIASVSRLPGTSPRQLSTPHFRQKIISVSPYAVQAEQDQDIWLQCNLLAGNTIDLPQVAALFNDMPTGSRLLVTQSANAIGGVTTVQGAANSILAPGGITASFTTLTFPSADFPNVTQMLLIKTDVQNQWQILSTSAGGSGSGGLFLQAGAGAVYRTFQDKDRDIISIKDFGAVGDGVTNDYAAFQLAAAALAATFGSNTEIHFPHGNYLLEYTGPYDPTKIRGQIAFNVKDVSNIKIIGHGARITITNHDIAVSNGLRVFNYDGVQNLEISGFQFDLSYVGRNDSATYYPLCGAITGGDTSGVAGARTGNELSSNINIHHNTFNLFHPYGAYAEALNSFPGDPNNGFKNFAFFASGDNLGLVRINQNFGVQFHNNTFLPTHNGYGVWVWAYNDVVETENVGLSWANKSTTAALAQGSGIPMLRNIMHWCRGIIVENNVMTPRALTGGNAFTPSRDIAGYEGVAYMCHLVSNNASDIGDDGMASFSNNVGALRTSDVGVVVTLQGTVNVCNNVLNGVDVSDRPTVAIDLQTDANSSNGNAYYNIIGNTTNRSFSGVFVRVNNGAAVAANRRLKVLTVKNNVVLNCYGAVVSFVNTGAAATFGVPFFYFDNNICDAEYTEFSGGNHLNTNESPIFGDGITEVTDIIMMRDNHVRYFATLIRPGAAADEVTFNTGNNVTTSLTPNYVRTDLQVRSRTTYVAGQIPRVGVANTDRFNYIYNIYDTVTLAVTAAGAGQTAGGTALSGALAAGTAAWIDQTLIAKSSL